MFPYSSLNASTSCDVGFISGGLRVAFLHWSVAALSCWFLPIPVRTLLSHPFCLGPIYSAIGYRTLSPSLYKTTV